VPLHAEAEPLAGVFDRFNDAVGRRGGHDQTFAHRLDRLVMPAVDGTGVAFDGFAHQPLEQTVFGDPDVMRDGPRRFGERVIQAVGHLGRDVLDERAAASDIQHLDAAADRKDRQIRLRRQARQLQLEVVAAGLRRIEQLLGRFPVGRWEDVSAAGQQNPVD
jgi:hypothetical protein